MPAQRRRLGSSLEDSDMAPKTIWPGESWRMPCLTVMILQCAGKMPETCTKLYFSMPAWRIASSSDCGRYLCLPTPLVKKTDLGTGTTHSLDISGRLQKIQAAYCRELSANCNRFPHRRGADAPVGSRRSEDIASLCCRRDQSGMAVQTEW